MFNRSTSNPPVQAKRLAKQEKHRKRWQRIAARRKTGSKRRKKAHAKASKCQQYSVNVRNDLAHQASHAMADDPNCLLFVVEALLVKNMTASAKGTTEEPGKQVRQKAGLNRSILESVWGLISRYLQYQAIRRGKLCIYVPPAYSSQECAACGHTHPDNRRSQAEFVCQACGHTDRADHNASVAIKRRGVKLPLSGKWEPKRKKQCGIRKIKVGVESSEPAEQIVPPTLEETETRHIDGNILADRSLIRETPATGRRA